MKPNVLKKYFSSLTNNGQAKEQIDYSKFVQIDKHKKELVKLIKKNEPFFAIDLSIVQKRLLSLNQALKDNFSTQTEVYYSLKTNYQLLSTNFFKKNNIGIEVVSGHEYNLAKKYLKTNKIIFNGPYKTDDEIIRGINEGATIHLDTKNQVDQITKIKRSGHLQDKKIKLGIRLKTHPNSRFGYNINNGEADQIIKELNDQNLSISSLHHHPGTDIYSTNWRYQGASKLSNWINHLPPKIKKSINQIDIGGGYPAHGIYPYHKTKELNESTLISDHIKAIKRGLNNSINLNDQIKSIISEPGRWLVEDSVIYTTQVLNVSLENNKQTITTNGTITQLPVAYYRSQIVKAFDNNLNEKTGKKMPTQINGCTCKEDDNLYKGYMPEIIPGDILIFFATGAYNQSMQSSFIFPCAKSYILDLDQNYERTFVDLS